MSIVDRLRRLRESVFAEAPHQRLSRALAKTLGYRVLMVLITVAVAFGVTGNTGEALSIGLVANVVKTGTYYGYERLWDRISWGLASAE
ncbi:MAG: DUF2061 domain-containing protein [Halonotius sp.]|jgi:uncharacterized membrane protein